MEILNDLRFFKHFNRLIPDLLPVPHSTKRYFTPETDNNVTYIRAQFSDNFF